MAAPTPMRPVPGAFFNTPAGPRNDPVRRRLFDEALAPVNRTGGTGAAARAGSVPAAGGQPAPLAFGSSLAGLQPPAQPAAPAPAAAPLPPIQKAAKSVNDVLQLDESYPDLDSYCRPGASSEYDNTHGDPSWAPFHKVQTYTIPDRVLELCNSSEVSTKMGLFSEINHAWAAVDNSLFLWDYSHPNPDLVGFEDQPHSITSVTLVPPKPGVFVKTITHILVVTTTTEIVLLGVAASATPSGAKTIALYQTKMTLHKGSADVSVVAGSAGGRIFFGGFTDTDVYELCYQQEEKWFSSRVAKICHTQGSWSSVVPSIPGQLWGQRQHEHLVSIVIDDTRNLVYTLSNRSTIRTYHMEAPNKLTKVIEKEKNHCLRDITHMINVSPLLTDRMAIVSISPISAREASKLHLMALTSTGCRLFLSATSPASYMMAASASLAPQSMQVQFIKFPPAEGGSAPADRRPLPPQFGMGTDVITNTASTALETSAFGERFAPGYFFDFVRKADNPGSDSLFVSAPETGRIKATAPASALKYYEHGSWIDLGPQSRALAVGQVTKPFAAARHPLGFGNELAVQFDVAPSEFAVLTNQGVHIVRRRRLVDIFATAIRGAVGEEGIERESRRFIQQYGRVETISAALAVACGQGSDLRTGTSRAIDQATQDRAKTTFIDYGGQPTLSETDGTVTPDSVKLSSRHDALALYLTRLIRMLWRSTVITPGADPSGGVAVSSTVPLARLSIVQESLERLRRFLDANKGIIRGLSGPSDLQRVASRQEEIALQAEHQALHALQRLMESISEGISFVLMLFDERVADIFVRLDDQSRQQLRELTYERLFSQESGKDLAKLLVKAIVNRNIESGSNVETVADALRRRCGSFCSPDDVVIFKAQEQLQRASEQQSANPNVVRALLNESLRLFERVAGSLTPGNLRAAVEQYLGLKYYAGAIQLCLVVAREKDRGNTALSWVNEGKPPGDPREGAFGERKRCYDLIHEVLRQLDAASSSEPELIDGRPTLAATKRMEAYAVVNDSDDEVFHFDLYEWYITQSWTDRILAIDSPHVITFLQRLAAVDARHADLLCRFYTHRSRFFEAAQVQADLAKSDFAIGIKDRITLLSRAKGNASVTTTGVGYQQQHLLSYEVTELLEIAHIQDDLLERLKADQRIPDDRKAEVERALDGPIKGLSELFNDYADQAGYYDLCLLIYHAADYHNPRVIAETWKELISSAHFEISERREAYEAGRAGRPVPDGAQVPDALPPLPYEAISAQIQTIAHRTSLDSLIFPVDTLLHALCEYALTRDQDAAGVGADNAWPVLLFLQLGVSHALLVRVLERIFDAQEAPFTGRRRVRVVEWVNAAVEAWLREVERRGGIGAGGAANGKGIGGGESTLGAWVGELLARCDDDVTEILEHTGTYNAQRPIQEVLNRTRALRRGVHAVMDSVERGSLRFM